jgi:hypothetical protein
MEHRHSLELIVAELVKNFPTSYGTRRLITVFTKASKWIVSKGR